MDKKYSLEDLIDIMATLRGENGCPWDKQQTHKSLIKYLREETEEVIENIEKDSLEHDLKEELGDVLLQIIFHAQIAKEQGRFDIYDVIDILAKKLKRRHPHVFGNEKASSPEEVKILWDKIKKSEKKN